jgi:hypoxia up-regulated 1
MGISYPYRHCKIYPRNYSSTPLFLAYPSQVLAERHYPLTPMYNETRSGVEIKVDGVAFTPEELVAMVLTHAVDISVAHAASTGNTIAPPRDVVLTVPAYSTVVERRAVLDAANLADLNVLGLIEENTAAALHYAMDKSFEDREQVLLFYNMGASAVQVSVVRFFNYEQPQKYGKPKSVPALEVLAKAWDETCGGLAFDHMLVGYLADKFNEIYKKERGVEMDVRTDTRAMTKIRLQANKIKHVLSANNDIPVYMDAVYDEVALNTHMTRSQLEDMAKDLLERSVQPVSRALEIANKTIADLTGTELIGGGMRIPAVQTKLKEVVGDLDLGMHINSDESFALGAAFSGANVSTAFRVRHVGLTDLNPFGMQISLTDLPLEDGAATTDGDEDWSKKATIFKSFGKIGVKKTITFKHDKDVHCALDYEESELLPSGTELALERYNITGVADFAKEMEEKKLGTPKVSLQFELSSSGITSLVKAEASVEETYTVEEEVEVDDDEAAESNATAPDEKTGTKDGETKQENSEAGKDGNTDANVTDAKDANETKNKDSKDDKKKKEEKPKRKMMVEKVRRSL